MTATAAGADPPAWADGAAVATGPSPTGVPDVGAVDPGRVVVDGGIVVVVSGVVVVVAVGTVVVVAGNVVAGGGVEGTVVGGAVVDGVVVGGTVVGVTVVGGGASHSVWNCQVYGVTASPRASHNGAWTDTSTSYQVHFSRFPAGWVSIMCSPPLDP